MIIPGATIDAPAQVVWLKRRLSISLMAVLWRLYIEAHTTMSLHKGPDLLKKECLLFMFLLEMKHCDL